MLLRVIIILCLFWCMGCGSVTIHAGYASEIKYFAVTDKKYQPTGSSIGEVESEDCVWHFFGAKSTEPSLEKAKATLKRMGIRYMKNVDINLPQRSTFLFFGKECVKIVGEGFK